MSEVSRVGSESSDELGFLADFIFVEEEKNRGTASVHNSETTVYDSEFDDASSSTSEEDIAPQKKSKQPADSLDSAQKRERKRERNRVGAKNTRLKKKQYVENLQDAISRLTDENETLNSQLLCLSKSLSQSSSAPAINDSNISSSSSSSSSCSNSSPSTTSNFSSVTDNVQSAKRAMILSDPALHGNPTVFASQGFLTLTGYDLLEVLGRNPRLLQGPGTDPQIIDMLSNNVKFGIPVTARLLNFKRGKIPFYNLVSIAPLRDSKGRLTNFVGTMFEDKGGKISVQSK